MSSDIIDRALIRFEKQGLVKGNKQDPPAYTYSPAKEDLQKAADEAFRCYNLQRVQVVNIIYSAPMQSFSDAFKLRTEDK